MNKNRLVILGSLIFAASLLYVALRLQSGRLLALRSELQLTVTDDVLKNLPVDIAFTQVALGSFRGLAVDYLWGRANQLKEEGKFYEMMQLSAWITKLQPRFPKVWEFHAWNLAYNISQATYTKEERWMWVQAGIRLLRDQGIPLNPKAVTLYQQLAYIFFHRVGKFSADVHWYFKGEHAREWHNLLGPPPEGTAEEVAAWFAPIAGAPQTPAELRAKYPEAGARLEALQALGYALDRRLLERVVALEALRDSGAAGVPASAADQKDLESGAVLLKAVEGAPGRALLACARAKVLRDEYHMDPGFMLELMRDFGPLDWRHPDAHAVYWAALGARMGERLKGADLFDIAQTDRFVLMGLQSLAFGGRVFFDPRSGYYDFLPDPRLFDAFEKACREASRRQQAGTAAPRELQDTHRGFLIWATQAAYLYGSPAKAAEYYQKLREIYGVEPRYAGLYTKPLEDFVFDQMTGNGKALEQAQQIVSAWSFLAVSRGLAYGRPALAMRFLTQARKVYNLYQEQRRTPAAHVERQPLDLPPLGYIVADAFLEFLLALGDSVPLRLKKRAWDGAPSDLQCLVYDRMGPLLEQARQAGWDPKTAFAEPPGMEQVRRQRAAGQPGAPGPGPAPSPAERRPEAERK